jgi:uncharacterized OsmC-like protein
MSQELARALDRVEAVFARRPQAAVHDDTVGAARWAGGVRVVTRHPSGREVETDMPVELGGGGGGVSPGWMVRAGVAACATTCVAMAAARDGIDLDELEVEVTSRSDSRGLFGMCEADGSPVWAGPHDLALKVRATAEGVTPERLRALVERAAAASPMLLALRAAAAVPLRVDVS